MSWWQGTLLFFYVVPAIIVTAVGAPVIGFWNALLGGVLWPVTIISDYVDRWVVSKGRHRRK